MTQIMNAAATLTIQWSKHSGSGEPQASFGNHFLSSRIGVRLREQRCPSCNSVLYTRRHNRCGVCEQVLPGSLLFTKDEAEKVDALLRTERQRHRAWLMRVEASPHQQ